MGLTSGHEAFASDSVLRGLNRLRNRFVSHGMNTIGVFTLIAHASGRISIDLLFADLSFASQADAKCPGVQTVKGGTQLIEMCITFERKQCFQVFEGGSGNIKRIISPKMCVQLSENDTAEVIGAFPHISLQHTRSFENGGEKYHHQYNTALSQKQADRKIVTEGEIKSGPCRLELAIFSQPHLQLIQGWWGALLITAEGSPSLR